MKKTAVTISRPFQSDPQLNVLLDLCCVLGSVHRPLRNSTGVSLPQLKPGQIRLEGILRDTPTERCLSYWSKRGTRSGGSPLIVLPWSLSPLLQCLLPPASVRSDIAANTTLRGSLQGCFSLQGHLVFRGLLCRKRTAESLTGWKRVGTLEEDELGRGET